MGPRAQRPLKLQVSALLQSIPAEQNQSEHRPAPSKPHCFAMESARGWTQSPVPPLWSARKRRPPHSIDLRGREEFLAMPPATGQPLHLLQPPQLNCCPRGAEKEESPMTLKEQGHSKEGKKTSVGSAVAIPPSPPRPQPFTLRDAGICSCPSPTLRLIKREGQQVLQRRELKSTWGTTHMDRQA